MALNQSALIELLKELELTDTTERIRLLTQRALQELINAEAETVIGAAPYERADGRTTQRNDTRSRILSTTAGDLDLRIPKLREGAFFPSLLERRRRVDQALFAVVMEAYVHGLLNRPGFVGGRVLTRRIDSCHENTITRRERVRSACSKTGLLRAVSRRLLPAERSVNSSE